MEERGVAHLLHEPMERHTTLRIGGPADCFAMPKNEEEILWLCRICREEKIPLAVVGNGSNLLVSDDGVEGVVLCAGRDFSAVVPLKSGFFAQAGASLAALSRAAEKASLSGLAFACGIPGTVGGAVFMNAGAYGGELADVIGSVKALDTATGDISEFSAAECGFGYRKSRFQTEENLLVLGASFCLFPGNAEEIGEKMRRFSESRREKQPLGFPNAGSAFQRPADGRAAAAMIDACGLKGVSVGGAQISEKHAGFLVNRGGASADDVKELLELVRLRVLERFGVLLEPEYRFLGRMK